MPLFRSVFQPLSLSLWIYYTIFCREFQPITTDILWNLLLKHYRYLLYAYFARKITIVEFARKNLYGFFILRHRAFWLQVQACRLHWEEIWRKFPIDFLYPFSCFCNASTISCHCDVFTESFGLFAFGYLSFI